MNLKVEIKQFLAELGLNNVEIAVYLAALGASSGSASTIAKSAGLNRVTTYEALKRLSARGLIKIRAKKGSGIRYFQAEEIDVVQEKLGQKKKELEQLIDKINILKPDFRSLYSMTPQKPEVLFYEGMEGIKNVLLDTLNQHPLEILSFASADSLDVAYNKDFLVDYWTRRTKLKIPSSGIMPRTKSAVSFFTPERNQRELRQVKFIPENIAFNNEIDIYGDNISIISLVKGNEHGIIIRSKSVADSLRSLFEFFWEQLQ